jgi:hypothetical protein
MKLIACFLLLFCAFNTLAKQETFSCVSKVSFTVASEALFKTSDTFKAIEEQLKAYNENCAQKKPLIKIRLYNFNNIYGAEDIQEFERNLGDSISNLKVNISKSVERSTFDHGFSDDLAHVSFNFWESNIFITSPLDRKLYTNSEKKIISDFQQFPNILKGLSFITTEDQSAHLKEKYHKLAKKLGANHCHIGKYRTSCFRSKIEDRYEFNQTLFKCLNSKGKEGLNGFDLERYVKDPKDLRCIDFSNVDFSQSPYKSIEMDMDTELYGSSFKGARIFKAAGKFAFVNFSNTLLVTSLKDAIVQESTVDFAKESSATISNTKFLFNDYPNGINTNLIFKSTVIEEPSYEKKDFIAKRAENLRFKNTYMRDVKIRFFDKSTLSFTKDSYLTEVTFEKSHFEWLNFRNSSKYNNVKFVESDGDVFVKKNTNFWSFHIIQSERFGLHVTGGSITRLKSLNSDLYVSASDYAQISKFKSQDNIYVTLDVLNFSKVEDISTIDDDKFELLANNHAQIHRFQAQGSQLEVSLKKKSYLRDAMLQNAHKDISLNISDSTLSQVSLAGLSDTNPENKIENSLFTQVILDGFTYYGDIVNVGADRADFSQADIKGKLELK